MECFTSLLFLFLGFASSERCSETLQETFSKSLNFTAECGDCVILSPGMTSEGSNWAGFCSGDKFFLFQDWKCREDNDLLNKTDYFVVGANEMCELVEENHALNEECLRKFNSEICSALSDSADLRRGDVKDRADEGSFSNTGRSDITEVSIPIETPIVTTETHTPEATVTIRSTGTTTTSSTPGVTTSPPPLPSPTDPPISLPTNKPLMNDCEKNEFFYNDHCYFFKDCWKYAVIKRSLNTQKEGKKFQPFHSDLIVDTTKCCRYQHPRALGLAVETKEEMDYIFEILRSGNMNSSMFLTSGIRWKSDFNMPDEWRGWNLRVDPSFVKVDRIESNYTLHYYIDTGDRDRSWFLVHTPASINILTICERPYNPKHTILWLHKMCLKEYRKSSCYNPEKQTNFCCAKDDKGELWFSCPSRTEKKRYDNNTECKWTCTKEGFFENDRPNCQGGHLCISSYNGIKYITTPARYAISGCPRQKWGLWGFSSWYCSSNQNFVGLPDYSLCCEVKDLQCKETDIFLNFWMGCPLKKTVKRLPCPPGSLLKEALVEWYCDKDGHFSGDSPDFSSCNGTGTGCVQVDRFGTEWRAPIETTQEGNCPPPFVGKCYWKCKKDGRFDGPEPDCSKCKADWMEKIEDKIRNDSNHEEVMEIMENYTKNEDLRVGYSYVLNLTSDCVALFKKQVPKIEINVFDKFLKSYSKILKNVAANATFWSSFSATNRGVYAKQVLNTTQNAAFAILESSTSFQESYNVTLSNYEADGFDFFVAYRPSVGSRFPLENFSESDWHLDVRKINDSNPTLAAMGLVMNYELTSLMFASGLETEDLGLNAPAVTFTVAESVNGEVVFDPNVVVSISFKHKTRTKFPQSQIIKRKLHKGEQPSGVFNSTVCSYYSHPVWVTEGCSVTFTSRDRTNCTCHHLSTIGLLMTIHKYMPDATMELLSVLSSAITIISLILALLVFYCLDNFRSERVLIGKNLCFCLLVGHFLLVTVLDKKFFNIPDNLCRVNAIFLHYVFLAAFAWMFVEGCHLYRMLVLVFESAIDYRRIYLVIGYGVPFVVVGLTALIGFVSKEQPYGQDEFCWLKPPVYVWAFVGPVVVTITINFCILVTATKQAISSKRRIQKSNSSASRFWLKGWFSLSTLLGITWFFGLAYIHYNEHLQYVFILLNGLQGFFIFLFRCVLCEQYKNVFLEKMKAWFSSSKTVDRKKSEIVKSETKLCTISASKSFPLETESKDSGYDPGTDRSGNEKKVKKPDKNSLSKRKMEHSSTGSTEVDITLTPEISEAYLRNRMIAKKFSIGKPKSTSVGDPENLSELSYHSIYHPQ